MTTVLYAQPYDISAVGFYFRDVEEYAAKAAATRNDFGQPVEEFEIQFIDGADIDAALANAIGLNQTNAPRFFEIVDEWDEWDKRKAIIAIGECGHGFDLRTDAPDQLDVDLYEMDSLRALAEHFVDEGLFGEIPEHLAANIDYNAIARDLGMDYAEAEIAGMRLIYRCA